MKFDPSSAVEFNPAEDKAEAIKFDASSAVPYTPRKRGLLDDIGSRLARGTVGLAKTTGHMLDTMDPDGGIDLVGNAGKHLVGFSENLLDKAEVLQPDDAELLGGESFVKKGVMEGLESAPLSLAPMLAGGAAGLAASALIPIPGARVVGGLLGATAGTLGLFGFGTYGEKAAEYDATIPAAKRNEEDRHKYALKHAVVEGGLEEVSNVVGMMTLGFGKVATQPLKQTARELLKTPMKTLAGNIAKNATLNEIPMEMIQGAIGAKIDQDYEMGDMEPMDAMAHAVIPAMTMSVLFGLGMHGVNKLDQRQAIKQLNGDDIEKRKNAALTIGREIGAKDQELGEAWLTMAGTRIGANQPIDIEENFVTFAENKLKQEAVGGNDIPKDAADDVPTTWPSPAMAPETPSGPLSRAASRLAELPSDYDAQASRLAEFETNAVGRPSTAAQAAEVFATAPESGLEQRLGREEELAETFSNLIPTAVRPAFDRMEQLVKEGEAGAKFNYQDGRTGDTHISYQNSTYPEWFGRQRGKTPWQGKWTRKEFFSLMNKLKAGTELNEKERDRARELYRAAQWTAENDHELTTGDYVDQIMARGFEPVFEKRPAVDLNRGDQVIVGWGSEIPKDEYEVKGVDQAGNIILQDGVTQRVDGFDLLNIEGVKRSGEEGFGTPLTDKSTVAGPSVATLSSPPLPGAATEGRPFTGERNADAASGAGQVDQQVQTGATGERLPDPGGNRQGRGGTATIGDIERLLTDTEKRYVREELSAIAEDIEAGENQKSAEEWSASLKEWSETKNKWKFGDKEADRQEAERVARETGLVESHGIIYNYKQLGKWAFTIRDLKGQVNGEPQGAKDLDGSFVRVSLSINKLNAETLNAEIEARRGLFLDNSPQDTDNESGGHYAGSEENQNTPGQPGRATGDRTDRQGEPDSGGRVRPEPVHVPYERRPDRPEDSGEKGPADGKRELAAPPPTPEPPSPALTVEDHSDKAIIVKGNTQENKDRIKAVPGTRPLWNRKAQGWVFPKRHEAVVRENLKDLLEADGKAEPPAAKEQRSALIDLASKSGTFKEFMLRAQTWGSSEGPWLFDVESPAFLEAIGAEGNPASVKDALRALYKGAGADAKEGIKTKKRAAEFGVLLDDINRQLGNEVAGVRPEEEATNTPLVLSAEADKTADKSKDKTKIEDFGEKIGGARKDLATKGEPREKKAVDSSPGWRKKFITLKKIDGSGWVITEKGRRFATGSERVFATEAEAEEAMPLYAVAAMFHPFQTEGKWEVYKRVGPRKRLQVTKQGFESREDAMKHMAANAETLLNAKTNFGEEILPVPDNVVRLGVERRTGEATPALFEKTFAPRAIEFGNWNNQEERQLVMNHAYDGLLDLAEVLNVPPKALMLNGELAIAFGARGQGLVGAKAHYESDYGVINLTKMKGAGSLAHEWMHAFDHYLARLDTKASSERVENQRGDKVYNVKRADLTYQSHGPSYKSEMRAELREAYSGLIKGMLRKGKQYVEDTKVADSFLAKARENLQNDLTRLRKNLAADLAAQYTWRKVKKGLHPASAEQLAEFDRLADILLEGGNLELELRTAENSKARFPHRYWTNDTLDAINDIYKAVRNRDGFKKEDGALASTVGAVKMYKQRIDLLADAEKGAEKTKTVTTDFAIEARKMDQARAGDYWSHPHEMAARAFAAYVEDKIAQQGGLSDFIVYHAHGGIILPMIDGFVARPYPEGKEREAINQAFDKFIGALKTEETDKGVILHSRGNKTEWPADFPNATTHTTLNKLKSHPDYEAAKAGDVEAAIRVVSDLVSPSKIKELKERHPDAIVLAPHASESAGNNAIPRVLAEAFGDGGFGVNTDVVQINEPQRTGKDSPLRLALRPEFDGAIEAGQKYILVDDAIGQGGTLAELRFFVESNGGEVVDISALTAGIFGNKISVRSETVTKLKEKFGHENLEKFLQEFNAAGRIEALTEKEGRFILRQPSLESLRDRILADAREAGISPGAWQVQTSLSKLAEPSPSNPDRIKGSGTTTAVVRAELETHLNPKGVNNLLDGGLLQIHQSEADAARKAGIDPGEIRGSQGFFVNDTFYLIGDNLAAGTAVGVYLHEAGVHYGLEEMVGGAKYDEIIRQLKVMHGFGNKKVRAARARVPKDTPAGKVWEETLGYLAEDPANHQMTVLQKVIAALKAWLFRMGWKTKGLTVNDVVMLIGRSGRAVAEGAVRRPGAAVDQFVDAGNMVADIRYSKEEIIRHAKAIYSKLSEVAANKFQGMKAQSVVNFLSNKGVTKVEMEAVGIDAFLSEYKPTDKVTREELLDFVQANTVELEDVVLGGGEAATLESQLQSLGDRQRDLVESDMDPSEYIDEWDDIHRQRKTLIAEIVAARKEERPTHFSQYTEPGSLEGSYREMFVTAPSNKELESFDNKVELTRELKAVDYFGFDSFGEAHRAILGHSDWVERWDVADRPRLIELGNEMRRVGEANKAILGRKWQDGHSQYSEVKNPIVRIRFNEVNADGNRLLRIEEMQGPSDANQKKMPAYLRDNIYQLGVKRILAYAKENGFDGVALATKPGMTAGETQADRYSLEKQISAVQATRGDLEDRYTLHVEQKGTIYEDRPRSGEKLAENIGPEELEQYVGKELSKKIINMQGGYNRFSGVDLAVGGEGLKTLYDTTIPNMLEKYSGEKIVNVMPSGGKLSAMRIGKSWSAVAHLGEHVKDGFTSKEDADTWIAENAMASAMPYIPLTGKTPDSFPMFSQKTAEKYTEQFAEDKLSAWETMSRIWKGRKTGWKGDQTDTSIADRLFNLPLHYFRKVAALGRMQQAAIDRNDDYHEVLYRVIGSPADGPHHTATIEKFRKERKEEYLAFGKYLFERDRNNIGYRIKEEATEDGAESWLLFDEKNKLVGRFETEHDAVDAMVAYEAMHFQKAGWSDQAVEALIAARRINNNGFNMLFDSMRQVIEEYKKAGKPLPQSVVKNQDGETVTINLKQALREMGDLRGSYMPRVRRPGRYTLRAMKDGVNPILEHFDTTLFMEKRRVELEAQGYTVTKEKAERLPEDVFQMAGEIVAMQAVINQAINKAHESKGATTLEELGLDIKGEWQTKTLGRGKRARSQKVLVVTGERLEKYRSIFSVYRGYKNSKGEYEFWDVNNYGWRKHQDIHKKLTQAILQQEVETSMDTKFMFAQAVAEQAANVIRARGFRAHMIKRAEVTGKDVWLGYEEDPAIALAKYARGLAAGEAKKTLALKLVRNFTGTDISWQDFKADQLLQGITKPDYEQYLAIVRDRRVDPVRQPNAFHDGKVFMEDMLRNDEAVDRLIGTVKAAAVLKYLGFRVSAPLVNLTALVTSVPAAMNGYAGIPLHKTAGLIARAGNGYRQYKKGEGGDLARVYAEIEEKGWHSAQFNREALSVLESRLGRGWNNTLEWSMTMFGLTEQFNRVATIAGTYAGIKAQHKGAWTESDHHAAMRLAKEVSDKSHGVYGKANRPHVARGGNPFAQVVRSFYMFKTFSHNYLATMKELGFDKKQRKAALFMALSPAVLAGAGASVLTPIIAQIFKAFGFGGDDPEEAFYSWLEESFGEPAELTGRYGIAALGGYGVNLKGSLAISVGDLPTSLGDLLGAPGSVVTDIYQGGENIVKGNFLKGFEQITPLAVGNVAKGIREGTEGLTTRTNAPIFYGNEPVVADTIDTIYRTLGFNPPKIAKIREKKWAETKLRRKYTEQRADIYARVRKFYLLPPEKRTRDRLAEIVVEIKEYNELIMAHGDQSIPFITSKKIQTNMRRSFQPPKAERIRAANQ